MVNYSTCSLMGGTEARCCWVHIILLTCSRNPRDTQAKIQYVEKVKTRRNSLRLPWHIWSNSWCACTSHLPRPTWMHHQSSLPMAAPARDAISSLDSRPAPAGARGRSFRFAPIFSNNSAESLVPDGTLPAQRTRRRPCDPDEAHQPIVAGAGRSLLIRP